MRKLLLVVVTLSLSLGAFAQAQMTGQDSNNAQGNDWYNQQLAANLKQFQLIAAATVPSPEAQAEGQSGALPQSMASNVGAQGADWYNQRLAAAVQDIQRTGAAMTPATQQQSQTQQQ